MMPTRKMPSKTPAPPIENKPGPIFLALCKFKISAPIRVPKTPETKAQGAINSGANIKAKIKAKSGGIKVGKTIPMCGTGLANILQTKIIKTIAIKTGSKGILNRKYIESKTGITAPPKFTAMPEVLSFGALNKPKKDGSET